VFLLIGEFCYSKRFDFISKKKNTSEKKV